MLSGDQCPSWTAEDILMYTEPKLGFTKESPGFLRLVDVLVEMDAVERKNFLQFTTGCSSLPPGTSILPLHFSNIIGKFLIHRWFGESLSSFDYCQKS